MRNRFDVVVVGAGHAGMEAAAAASRMGCQVAVVTLHLATAGQMPCNPAVGGIGKGHLVAEIDALGGLQGWAADRAGLQFKTLNASRGPAVWGPRVQCDKERYARTMARLLRGLPRITVIEGEAVALQLRGERVVGVTLGDGTSVPGRAVILTTGTFLGGILHTGEERVEGGRFGERPSRGLGASLSSLGLELLRFKTGTPPRLHRDSIDFERLGVQEGDATPKPFSWRTGTVRNRAVCWVGRTPEVVQKIIADNLDRSPLFSGLIEGVGPRYCPSIEDKVVRFPHHREHTVFLEPETEAGPSLYVNGMSTSLPKDVQEAMVRAVPGFERAEFLRYGYAVEYDVVRPGGVRHDLRAVPVEGLYLAGQLLGTSGYEEAAGLGLIAGVNAAATVLGREGLRLGRDQAYLGVLVDDLVTRHHLEPYRLFTSRAEHRLLLGVDSSRERLMADGVRLGLVPERVFHVEQERWARRREAVRRLETAAIRPTRENRQRMLRALGVELTAPTTLGGLLRRREVDADAVFGLADELPTLNDEDRRVVAGRVRYAGYLERQERQARRMDRMREARIPEALDFRSVSGLSREVVESLERHRPRTLAEASGLAAVTPAALALLAGRLTRGADG
jgi:tRNA uridine 5-carboxymethylaminomethyl modification enzyme